MSLFAELRAREFSRLDRGGHVYLDYTGAGLYAERQVRAHADYLCGAVLGNPHSRNPSSQAATDTVEAARRRVLEFFGADPAHYEVIFTPVARLFLAVGLGDVARMELGDALAGPVPVAGRVIEATRR